MRKGGCFFGRRQGKTLSNYQKTLLQDYLDNYIIDINKLDFYELFPKLNKIHLEIGFGGGEALCHKARLNPDIGFIGVEVFTPSIVKLLSYLKDNPDLSNIRIYNDDAYQILSKLSDNLLHNIDLFYPDPWPKKRHNKRRFINNDNIDHIMRILVPKGIFRFVSDNLDYVNWTLRYCEQSKYLKLNKANFKEAFANWLPTRYEKKAISAGLVPYYLEFINEKY